MKKIYLIRVMIFVVSLILFTFPSLALIPGDFTSDDQVDFEDLMIFALAYGSTPMDDNWNPICDIASSDGMIPDGVIDFEDLMLFAMNYGEEEGIEVLYELLPDIENCNEGILKDSEKQIALDELNYIRSLHGLNPVSYNNADDLYTAKAALIIVANKVLNHDPPPSYKCWTEEGQYGCLHSNLSMSWGWVDNIPKSEDFIIRQVIDNNVESLGHRRWLLFPFLKSTSYGRVDIPGFTGAVIKVINDKVAPANVDFVTYPYEEYPGNLFLKDWYLSFSVVADRDNQWNNANVDFSDATIEMHDEDGDYLDIHSIHYDNLGYGIPNHLQWKADGIEHGIKYIVSINNVEVLGVITNYSYWFKLI